MVLSLTTFHCFLFYVLSWYLTTRFQQVFLPINYSNMQWYLAVVNARQQSTSSRLIWKARLPPNKFTTNSKLLLYWKHVKFPAYSSWCIFVTFKFNRKKLEEVLKTIPTNNGFTNSRWKDINVSKWSIREVIKEAQQKDM
jgi:hypothetical protein